MWLGIAIAAVAIIAALCYRRQKESRLKSEGKIIDRKGAFYEKAQEFTLSLESPEAVAEKIRALPYGEMRLSMNGDGRTFRFTGNNFSARLWLRECSEGRGVYRFQFDNWKTNDLGGPMGYFEMNVLLTAVEKMFLSIDPGTQVRTWNLETHTKSKFF